MHGRKLTSAIITEFCISTCAGRGTSGLSMVLHTNGYGKKWPCVIMAIFATGTSERPGPALVHNCTLQQKGK